MNTREQLMELGCADGSCFLHPHRGGMHTNSMCHCVPRVPTFDEWQTIRKAFNLYRQLVKELETDIEDLKLEHVLLLEDQYANDHEV